ncbi:PhoU domain-containing protein [Candidatus Eisenbacteria bacterium]|uniref:PhoU domain-containing protein n=1 Tax=Eiseniibacteriota bacterium TaxID=2212470 RepID=A0ABV6YMA6_UNCEI
MLKRFMNLWRTEGPCEEAWQACMTMLRESMGMFTDAVASLREEPSLKVDIYTRDRALNKFERAVRRNIVTHLAVSTNPDINTALVLTAIVIDIERIGDYTKNIVELATAHEGVFRGGEIAREIEWVETTVTQMFNALIPVLENSDSDRARQVLGDHQMVADRVEDCLQDLIAGRILAQDPGAAVTAALYLRYLKRVSAHLKNVASSVVNPYYRIGFREKVGENG